MRLLRGHWQLFVLTAAVFALWQTPIVVPLKILVVFFHEASHAAATFVTGGDVVSLSVSPDQGGLVVSRGGSRFWILTSGYLGSLLIGVGLLLGATRSQADRKIMAGCGVIMLAIAGLYVRDVFAFAFIFGTGVMMLLCARYLGHRPNDLMLRLIGLTSIIYVPFDIFSDTISRAALRSDARMLAEEFGGTTQLWGGFWIAISFVVIAFALRRILGRNSNLSLR